MNFTREPIIETIITPKEGYKLIVRNSRMADGENYHVDAVEVVSFGSALFFRSKERPKAFLVPVADFEIVETRETRVVLKHVSFERSIKIGGGKEASFKAIKEKEEEPQQVEQRLEKKRERRRPRRRRSNGQVEAEASPLADESTALQGKVLDGEPSAPIARLIPPPTQLISEQSLKSEEGSAAQPAADATPLPPTKGEKVEAEKPKRTRRRKKAEPQAGTSPLGEPSVQDAPKDKQDSSPAETDASEQGPAGPPAEGGEPLSRAAIEGQETVKPSLFSAFRPTDWGSLWKM